MCGRSVLKSMDWVKRKGTTGKVKPSKQLLAEEKYTFHISVSKVILSMNVPVKGICWERSSQRNLCLQLRISYRCN